MAVVLSLATTGLGQLYNGQWKKALVLGLIPFPGLLIAAHLVRTTSLAVWAVAGIAIALFALGVAVDAFLNARRQRDAYSLQPFNRVAIYVSVIVVMVMVSEATKAFVKTTVVRAYRMPSESMKPTFEVGDYFMADMAPAARRPIRGGLIVHQYPPQPRQVFVKRVVAIEGDVVELRDKSLFVNGMPVSEPYVIHEDPSVEPAGYPRDNLGPVTVPEGFCFAMGDNRDNSNDSRFFGPIDDRLLLGRPLSIYWSWDPRAMQPRWDRVGRALK